MEILKRVVISFCFQIIICNLVASGQTSYYLSSIHGNDNNTGVSQNAAWNSISKLQQVLPNLKAGDKIFFERGSIWYNVSINLSEIKGTASEPIQFIAYGNGAAPVLSGSIIVGSLARNGNLWSTTSNDFPEFDDELRMIAGLYIDGGYYQPGRTPNDGYYVTQSRNTSEYFDDYDNTWPDNYWQGGQIVARTEAWFWDKATIQSSSSNRFYINGLRYNIYKEKTYYYIQNHVNTLDNEYEWAVNNNTLTIYSSSDLTRHKIELPIARSIVTLNDCEYIYFSGLHITKANIAGIHIQKGSSIRITDSKISYCGETGIRLNSSAEFTFTGNMLTDCFSNGIMLDDPGKTNIENNEFKRTSIYQGMPNGTDRSGSAISCYRAQEDVTIQYNRFDSVMIAVQGHFSHAPLYIQNNLIEDYGMQLGDMGAIYLEGEGYGDIPKYIRKNIILNSHVDDQTVTPTGLGNYSHGIYLDYDCSGVIVDSNTVVNTSAAIKFNRVRSNKVTNNNFAGTGNYVSAEWRTAVVWNQNTGELFDSLANNEFYNNQIVIGDDPLKYAFLLHDVGKHVNRMDNNTYLTPFRSDDDVITYASNYTSFSKYTISEWTTESGQEANSGYGHPSTKYNSSLGISKNDFVKVFYNPRKKDFYQSLKAKYVNKDGIVYDKGVVLKPYSSIILFYNGPTDYPNHAPVINNQSFTVKYSGDLPSYIGQVTANDPDEGQKISYEITSGNNDLKFVLSADGRLYVNSSVTELEDGNYVLGISVSDNGSPSLSASANIIVSVERTSVNLAPLIENQVFKYMIGLNTSLEIGKVVATDPDVKDQLTYDIISGDNGMVIIDHNTGELTLSGLAGLNEGSTTTLELLVEVTDDGYPACSKSADITVIVVPEQNIVYIDPSASEGGSGTFDNPYSSLADVQFSSGKSYLVKRNTVSNVGQITINCDDILIGAYGQGDIPVILSNSYEHVFKTIDKEKICIENLHIDAENAVSGFYFLGPSSSGLSISKCVITGPDYGIRLINVKDIKIQYCRIEKTTSAIYQIAQRSEINFNLLKDNHTAIQVISSGEETNVFNNLFYNNSIALRSDNGVLNVFNNIFYQKNPLDKAIWVSSEKYLSDFNLIYPEYSSFYILNDVTYNRLEEVKNNAKQEMNSLCEDPGFVDIENNNYHLEKSSPAVDAGVYVGLIYDFNGAPIPFGLAPDIGLIETSDAVLSVEQVSHHDQENIALRIFPNPASDLLNLNYSTNSNDIQLRVYNLYGLKVIEKNLKNYSTTASFGTIDVSYLANGVYILYITDGERTGVQKFVKK